MQMEDDMLRRIWSNADLNIDDWREDYKEFCDNNSIPYDPKDDDAVYDFMIDTNDEYLGDERVNLNIQLSNPILVIADLGRWNGRVTGCGEITSGNIKDCLYTDCDMATWYIDKKGDLKCNAVHHDGTNVYTYREVKNGVGYYDLDELKGKIIDGTATKKDIDKYTRRLGDDIAKVFGWELPKEHKEKQKKNDEPER